jgi:hypothetical protein
MKILRLYLQAAGMPSRRFEKLGAVSLILDAGDLLYSCVFTPS